jgi:small nuclear ribonucleoprotein (snRNP)-like protein
VDQYLNIKLLNVSIVEPEKFPHMVRRPHSRARAFGAPVCTARAARVVTADVLPASLRPPLAVLAQQSVKHCFVRGSVIRYAQLPKADIDVELLQDATRKEAQQQRAAK